MRGLPWLLALALVIGSLSLLPSPQPVAATHGCASAGSPAGPFNLVAYEAADWRTAYRRTLELAGFNQLFPDLSAFAVPPIETGPRSAGSSSTVSSYVPPALLKATAWIESAWQMADSSVAYGEIGPPLISHSCAYGIMQILSGMENTGSAPTLAQVSTGAHYGFNIARGSSILAQKWNYAPSFRPIVGSRNPALVEDWYYAIWSYNGFSFTNHPLNPAYDINRGAYRCDGTQSYASFPYQELVLGCLRNPPVVSGLPLWSSLPVTLPNPSDPAFSLANWNACSGSNDCAAMDISTPSPSHTDPTGISASRNQAIGTPVLSVSPLDITLGTVPGGESGSVTITVANSGTGPLAWRSSPTVSWLSVSGGNRLALGTNLGSLSSTLSVSASSAGLSPGVYTGEVRISSLYPLTTATINVTLVVASQRGFVPGVIRD